MSAAGSSARAAAVLAVCTLAAAIASQAAFAHAVPVRVEPADGAVLRHAPRQARLWFDEDVVAALSAAEVLDARGRAIATLRARADSGTQGLVSFALPELRRGVYSLRWNVLGDDGHTRAGEQVFRVGAGASPPPAGAEESSPSAVDVVLRWLELALLAVLVGAVGVAGLVFGPLERRARGAALSDGARRAQRRALACAAFAASLSAVLAIGALLWQTSTLARGPSGGHRAPDLAWQLLTDSGWGSLWLARESALVLLVGVLVASRWAAARVAFPLATAAALAVTLVGIQALSGHAASAPGAVPVAIAAVHLLAAAMWTGGLVALTVGLWPELRGMSRSPDLVRTSFRSFGIVASLSVALLVVTGLLYAGRQVASPDALLTTMYGGVLVAKVGLFLAAGAIGLAGAALVHPRAAAPLAAALRRPRGWTPFRPARLRTLVLAEAGLGLAVIAAAGVLTATPPARGPQYAPTPGPPTTQLSQTVDDLLVTVSVRPGVPGPNVFEALAVSTRRPALAPVERVSLRFSDPSGSADTVSARMRRVEDGRYRLGGDFFWAAGTWRLDAVVERPGLGDSVASFSWNVASGTPRSVLVSDRPLGPVLTAMALAVALAVALAFAWVVARALLRDLLHLRPPLRREAR